MRSSCYKEATFENIHLDVWLGALNRLKKRLRYLTQWVSIWQFIVSFVYMPLLVLPGFSSKEGMSVPEVLEAFWDGWSCYTQQDVDCAQGNAFLLLTGEV